MKLRDFFKKKYAIVEEIEELEEGLELFTIGRNTGTAHFEMVAHYGDTRDYQEIPIGREYNDRFISLVKEIIKEKEQMLKERIDL